MKEKSEWVDLLEKRLVNAMENQSEMLLKRMAGMENKMNERIDTIRMETNKSERIKAVEQKTNDMELNC